MTNERDAHVDKEMKKWLESNHCSRCGVTPIPDNANWCVQCRPEKEREI